MSRIVNFFVNKAYIISPQLSKKVYEFFSNRKEIKVFIAGSQKNWALGKEMHYLSSVLKDLNIILVSNPNFADIIHSIWWNKLLTIPNNILKEKYVLAWASNFIEINDNYELKDDFNILKNVVDIWICPSTFQEKKLENENLETYLLSNYVDENLFFRKNNSRRNLCEKFNIDYNLVKGKKIIGSFQRDSLGSDLTKPKPQKGADNLAEILNDTAIKKESILLLAGPRRHYIIRKCKEYGIPYIFVGNSRIIDEGRDDVNENIIDWNKMPDLYNLIDLYIVSSRSEGGPNAVLEAAWCKTLILSSKVGLAQDFLVKDCIYDDINEAKKKVIDIIFNLDEDFYRKTVEANHHLVLSKSSYGVYRERLNTLYSQIINEIRSS